MKKKGLKKIGILGLGLMGGSLAARCRKVLPSVKVVGISRTSAALKFAKTKEWIHEGTTDVNSVVNDLDLLVLCGPVDVFLKQLREIDRQLTHKLLVTDVGSVKHKICTEISKVKWKHVVFVSAHPMVGSHERGVESASKELYEGGTTILITNRKVGQANFNAVKTFWKKVTPHVLELTSKKHDEWVCAVSHLPHAVATCLVAAVSKKAFPVASTGFSDTTRIAEANPEIWAPIFLQNKELLLKSLDNLEDSLDDFRSHLKSPAKLKRYLARISQKRQELPRK